MGQDVITSVHNPLVKRLRQLLERKGRDEQGRFLVEGVHLVEEALRSQAGVVTLLYDHERGLDPVCERALREASSVQVFAASSAVLAKLSETKSPQGIVAEVIKPRRDWEGWLKRAEDCPYLILMLDEIQDPGNLGTILRTAEAAGVDAVILGKGSVDLYNGKVVRSTMGALFRLPVFSLPLAQAVESLQRQGARLLVSSLHEKSLAYDEAEYSGKTVIVIGNEGRGVSAEMLAKANSLVHIPLYGRAESLNAAVAAGILVYEAQRQRHQQR
jgi:TrmH family RNA methyltransferase